MVESFHLLHNVHGSVDGHDTQQVQTPICCLVLLDERGEGVCREARKKEEEDLLIE